MNQSSTDSELVTRCLQGDTLAFGLLIDRHHARLARLLRAILRDPFAFDDVWQETLLRAYLNLEQLREPARFGAWLCTIAINLARTQRNNRSLKTFAWDSLDETTTDHAGWVGARQPSLETLAIRQELSTRVRQAIADLPPAEREAVMLVYLDELSHQEAALQLGASLSAVKVRVHRGRERLRAALQAEFAAISPSAFKGGRMIPVEVHDVMMTIKHRQGQAQSPSAPGLLDLLSPFRVLLLKEQMGTRVLPIWVGAYEAANLLHHLAQQETKRPLTYDLTRTLLALGNITVEQVVIHRLYETTFYANFVVKIGDTISEVDCRPSDALNLALRFNAPIFVAADVLEQHSFPPDADGSYSLATCIAVGLRNAPTEEAKENLTRAREAAWVSVRSLNAEQLVSQRAHLLQELSDTLLNERAMLLEETEFRRFLAGFWG